jgi:hypothetical protein
MIYFNKVHYLFQKKKKKNYPVVMRGHGGHFFLIKKLIKY